MKKCAYILAVLLTLASCSNSNDTLYLYNWTYYTPDSIIEQFEAEFSVTVKVDSYDSNEALYTKLKSGATGYDVVVPSQDYVSIMIKEGLLAELDHSKLPNIENLNPQVIEKATYDPNLQYSIPYFWGAAGIAVNKSKVESYDKSWNIFSQTDLAKRMSMMDDMREVFGDALSHLGYSINTTNESELKEAQQLIQEKWKPNLVKFDAEGFARSFASGDFWVVQGYPEAIFDEVPQQQWDSIDFFIPQEGAPMYIDSLCVLKNSKNYDLAMEFINFIHRPEIYAQFLDRFYFPATVNEKASAFRTTTPRYQPSELNNCELKYDLGESIRMYNDAWQQIRYE
ncbi:MAG: extracellular solute-binding protein [Treponemataceae bacterium]